MKLDWRLVGYSFFFFGMALIFYLLLQNNGVRFDSLLYNLIEAFGFVFAILGWISFILTSKTKQNFSQNISSPPR